jgi:UDP-N-acetylmuramoylalanine--D-glutamate ligase
MPVGELGIPGRHNVSNALAAIAVGMLFGVAPDAIRRAAGAFAGVEHRLQPVALVDGVRYVNDSMGTQPDAVIAALRAFPAPVVLIAGGRDKGVDLSEFIRVAADTAYGAVLMGESGPLLQERLTATGLARTVAAGSMDEAVRLAAEMARAARVDMAADGVATVLMSPAAASFDMYEDYAARGRAFIAAVAGLATPDGRG